jgi:hypothetical protein
MEAEEEEDVVIVDLLSAVSRRLLLCTLEQVQRDHGSTMVELHVPCAHVYITCMKMYIHERSHTCVHIHTCKIPVPVLLQVQVPTYMHTATYVYVCSMYLCVHSNSVVQINN